ncbi:MAG TPA: hypothetical protein VFV19_18880 [Candidatus Polarisedimenticolaceae bacterium]|nr:hypothetical protein [Candidatus Polarisedimenticolaceae bacterium]
MGSDLRERYTETEKRLGTVFLSLVLLSVLYWLSFALFLQDPQRALVPAARRFVRAIDQLETDQVGFRSLYDAKIFQAIEVGERFLHELQGPKWAEPVGAAHLDLNAQVHIDDRRILGLINQTNSRDFSDLVRSWLEELKWLRVRRIVLKSEVLEIWTTYYSLNEPPGWLTTTANALKLPADLVSSIPKEVDEPDWNTLSANQIGVLFQGLDEFDATIADLQGFYQGPITDRMQAKALRGTGIWLRNLDSGRSIAHDLADTEPSIRLPVVGENVTGRIAFLLAPLLYFVMVRYLLVLADEARGLREQQAPEARDESASTPARSKKGRHDDRLGPRTHMIELLSTWLVRREGRSSADVAINRSILLGLFCLPISTLIPVAIVNATIFTSWWRGVALALLSLYAIPLIDTVRLARGYLFRGAGLASQ